MVTLHSLFKLGWAFAKVLARRIFGSDASQLPRFVANYEHDGIVLFEEGDAAVLDRSSRCIACGRCDTQALLDDTFTALGPEGPMAFVLGVSRHSGEHDAATITAAATDVALESLTEVCPVDVPFVPLVAIVKRRRDAQRVARALPAPGATAMLGAPEARGELDADAG